MIGMPAIIRFVAPFVKFDDGAGLAGGGANGCGRMPKRRRPFDGPAARVPQHARLRAHNIRRFSAARAACSLSIFSIHKESATKGCHISSDYIAKNSDDALRYTLFVENSAAPLPRRDEGGVGRVMRLLSPHMAKQAPACARAQKNRRPVFRGRRFFC
jgi:hypothetical protein